jgi:hypothetical protein
MSEQQKPVKVEPRRAIFWDRYHGTVTPADPRATVRQIGALSEASDVG